MVKLNQRAYEHAQNLIKDGKAVPDDRGEWTKHQASAKEENTFIEDHGIDEYARWYLGVDDEVDEGLKSRYKFPFGDFAKVHRCGVIAAESRAEQRDYHDIGLAAAHLHGMLEEPK